MLTLEERKIEVNLDSHKIEPLPGRLAVMEKAALDEEFRRRLDRARAEHERLEREREEADANWQNLKKSALFDLCPELSALLQTGRPAEFTGQALEWDFELILPGGRPPLWVRYRRFWDNAKQNYALTWQRVEIGNDATWGVPIWTIDSKRAIYGPQAPDGYELVADRSHMRFARGLPTALCLAHEEALRLPELREQLNAMNQELLGVPAQNEEVLCQCTVAERQMLDDMWDQPACSGLAAGHAVLEEDGDPD